MDCQNTQLLHHCQRRDLIDLNHNYVIYYGVFIFKYGSHWGVGWGCHVAYIDLFINGIVTCYYSSIL